MEQRKMKGTEEMVSLLGLGCMRFPHETPGSDDINVEKAEKMIDYAIKHGVNYFDTAYPYHGHQSEPFLGQAMKKYPRESFYLASKLPMWYLKKEADVARYFEEQLERCQVEYFDFYLCHAMNEERFQMLQEYHIFEKLAEYKKQGKIRHIGFSFHDSPEVLEKICSAYPWEFAQIQLNYVDWDFQDAKAQYEILERHGLPAIIMEPVRGGALADLGEGPNQVLKRADQKASIASWAIRYAASLPNVLTVLSGMSTDEQLADNIQTMTDFQPLSADEREALENALEIYRRNVLIPCTGCRYCIDCPVGIDIPSIFRLYNHFSMNRHTLNKPENEFLADYQKIEESCRADQCIGCQNCVSHCPQSIQVPEELAKIAAFVSGLEKNE
ncbi:MAG: aldo/keto reductase [[Clostridium] leptum]